MELWGRAGETESETLQRHMSTTMGCKVWKRETEWKRGEKGGKQSEEAREREAERMKTNSEHFNEKEDSQVILLRRVHFCKLLHHAETKIEYFPPETIHLITPAFAAIWTRNLTGDPPAKNFKKPDDLYLPHPHNTHTKTIYRREMHLCALASSTLDPKCHTDA